MSSRDRIATALATVPGVTGHPTTPGVVGPGTGWAQWAGSAPAGQLGACHTLVSDYDVLVTLPAAPQVAAAETERLLPLLLDAMRPLGAVDRAEPATVVVDDGATTPAIRIRITIAEETTP